MPYLPPDKNEPSGRGADQQCLPVAFSCSRLYSGFDMG